MQKIKDYIYFNRKEIIAILIIIGLILYIIYDKDNIVNEKKEEIIIEKEDVKEEIKKEIMFAVDIKGEVKKPGIYELEEGKRIIDVIKEAGGITEKANTNNINLSEKITDEMLIIIPSIDEELNTQKNEIKTQKNDNKVSINTASESELMTINGIGKTKAKKIIEYRDNNGKFKSIEDIKNVSGIGDSIFEKIKNYIKV